MESIINYAKRPLGQRGMIYVAPKDGKYVVATLSGHTPKIISLTMLKSLKQTVMLWNPQSGTHRLVHTDDIG